jgi:hypothetical protein
MGIGLKMKMEISKFMARVTIDGDSKEDEDINQVIYLFR